MVRVAINGYGRIGRVAHRVMLQWHSDEMDVVAINVGSSTDLKGWMYLLKYDSVYGLLPFEVSIKPNPDQADKAFLGHLVVNGKDIPVYSQKDPTLLPWRNSNVDVVIEATGVFTTKEKASLHLAAGAKSVVLSAPGKEGDMPTYVISVNDESYQGENVISNASCTTNCIAPVAKAIGDAFGIDKAMMTTIHAYTSDQELQDGGHKDYRRARAAGLNIVPTSTGATIAAAEAYPPLKGIFAGLSIRVPVPVGSLSDFTFLLKRNVTVEEVNSLLKVASDKPEFKGILAVSEDPLVSSDIIGNSHSSIADLTLTQVVGGNMLKVIAWYDNEYGYANRLVEQAVMVGAKSAVGPSSNPSTSSGQVSTTNSGQVSPAGQGAVSENPSVASIGVAPTALQDAATNPMQQAASSMQPAPLPPQSPPQQAPGVMPAPLSDTPQVVPQVPQSQGAQPASVAPGTLPPVPSE